MVDQSSNQRASLKSHRGARNKSPAITVWKCPECKYFNPLGENTKCQNENDCAFDVRDGDADPDFSEMTERELKEHNSEYKKSHSPAKKREVKKVEEEKQEPAPLADDDWECEYCKTINKMILSNKASAKCSKCFRKNEIILHMIEISQSKDHQKQAQIEMDVYKKWQNEGEQ